MLYPMYAMVVLVLIVGVAMGRARFKAVAGKQVDGRYFRLYQGYEVPADLRKLERHFSNLFEVPVLFFAFCLSAMVLHYSGTLLQLLAWIYVGLRYLHAVIHLTYNHVYHRFFAFVSSTILLFVMWTILVVSVG